MAITGFRLQNVTPDSVAWRYGHRSGPGVRYPDAFLKEPAKLDVRLLLGLDGGLEADRMADVRPQLKRGWTPPQTAPVNGCPNLRLFAAMPRVARGHTEQLPSGSFRVSVYARTDPPACSHVTSVRCLWLARIVTELKRWLGVGNWENVANRIAGSLEL